jgi:hypothetical protein
MDYFAGNAQFNTLSLPELLKARDQFHPHLMHKANVVGTAVGRYLIRASDPYPGGRARADERQTKTSARRPPRTLENSEVRDYSWPCVLVFVSEWVDDKEFGGGGGLRPSDYVPKTIYLEDGQRVPVCLVLAPPVETPLPSPGPEDFKFPDAGLAGGYPVIARVQGAAHIASIGCLLTDGHKIYALTNRHVAGEPDETLTTIVEGQEVPIGRSSTKQLGRLPFEKLYQSWPGKQVYVNMDVGLIELDDQTKWSPSIYGVGRLGPLADLSIYNLTLSLIGCPVRAFGCASGRLYGRIAALFYRYKAVGGFEYVADFLIGSRNTEPLRTRPGDSGTVWVVESEDRRQNLMPIAVQWGGAVFSGESTSLPFALATNLSNVCRELEVDLFRSRDLAAFEYWGPLGHYSIGSFACDQIINANLKILMQANRRRISFEPDDLTVGRVSGLKPTKFVPLANVPDVVLKDAYSQTKYGRASWENPNHYADIDYGTNTVQTLDAQTPTAASLKTKTWRQYYDAVGWTEIRERGLLPFRVWQIYKQMVEAVASGRVAWFVAAAGVLAHYVGDACQPLHGSYLTDGDPFRFKNGKPSSNMLGHGAGYGGGIHSVYETSMLNNNINSLLPGLRNLLKANHGMKLVKGGQRAGFATVELMRRASVLIKPRNLVNTYGDLVKQGQEWKATTVLWSKFGGKSIETIADGYRTLAMLWDSAWAEGGGDQKIAQADLVEIPKQELRDIYEDRVKFVPSMPLDKIDPYL